MLIGETKYWPNIISPMFLYGMMLPLLFFKIHLTAVHITVRHWLIPRICTGFNLFSCFLVFPHIQYFFFLVLQVSLYLLVFLSLDGFHFKEDKWQCISCVHRTWTTTQLTTINMEANLFCLNLCMVRKTTVFEKQISSFVSLFLYSFCNIIMNIHL